MVTKEEVTKESHNLVELRRMTRRLLKGRDLKVFSTVVERMVKNSWNVGPRKSLSKAMRQPPK